MAPDSGSTTPSKVRNSFTTRTIDLLIEQNPDLDVELNLLKKSVRDHEQEFEQAKEAVEAETYQKVWESIVKIERLETSIKQKDDFIAFAQEKLDQYEQSLDKAEQELNQARNQIHLLQQQVQKKHRKADLLQREYSSAVVRLEREERSLIFRAAQLERQVGVETSRADSQAKESGPKSEASIGRLCECHRGDSSFNGYYEETCIDPGLIPSATSPVPALGTICEEDGVELREGAISRINFVSNVFVNPSIPKQ